MNTQPEALRLIQHIKDEWPEDWDGRAIQAELRRLFELAHEQHTEIYGLRAELRRLHQVNADLLEALRIVLEHGEFDDYPNTRQAHAVKAALAAIAKATGEQ